MRHKIIVSILLIFFAKIEVWSFSNDSTSHPINKSLVLHSQKDSLAYPIPFIVFHLGGSMIFSNGSMQLNGRTTLNGNHKISGTEIDYQDDLDFPSNTFSPRVNVYLRFNKHLQFLFDFYAVRRRETTTLTRDLQFENTLFSKNSIVRSKFSMFTFNLAYRYSFLEKKHYDLGVLIGLTGLNYKLDLRDNLTSITEKTSVFLPMPLIGADAFVYLGKDVFLRAIINYSGSPIDNYKFSVVSFKPFVEYYFSKNVGIGLKYLFTYTNVIDLDDSKFDGKYKLNFNAVSLVGTFRFY